jgi:hypothetical protein
MEVLGFRNGSIFGPMYASGSVGRIGVGEVLDSVRERGRLQCEAEEAETAKKG